MVPTHRKSRQRPASAVAAHVVTNETSRQTRDSGKKKISTMTIRDLVFARALWKKYWAVVGILAMIAVGRLFHTNYSLELMLESTEELPYSGENRTASIVSNLPKTKQSNTSKFEWDGSLRGRNRPMLWFNEEMDNRKIPIFRAEIGRHQVLFMGMGFGQMRYTGMLLPCRLDQENNCLSESSSMKNAKGDPLIVMYNPLQEDRFWCGERIPGGDILLVRDISDDCRGENNVFSLPYVYSKGPPAVLNEGIYTNNDDSSIAVELFEESIFSATDKIEPPTKLVKVVECSVPCKRREDNDYLKIIKVANTNWTLRTTIEGERYYPFFKVRPMNYRKSIFYATTSFKSEIPMPYFSLRQFSDRHPAIDFDKVIKGASFIAKNCNSHNRREDIVSALIETELRVDSLSKCLNNAEPPPGADIDNKKSMQAQYLFHLAFENQNVDDYITEKLWDTFKSGTLPVYLGATNIKEHVPKNSIIVAEDFENPQALADYLVRVSKDKDLYESYHKWRDEPVDDWFVEKYEFTNTPSICRTCKWAYAKRHGLGWNPTKQAVLNPQIHRKICQNANGLIEYPFQEHWFSVSPDAKETKSSIEPTYVPSSKATKTCELNDKNRVIELANGTIRRKVYDRDGVTDLFIDFATDGGHQSTNQIYLLRLETPIKLDGTNQEPHVVSDSAWWIQDDQSRLYVMVNGDGDIKLSVHKPGTIEIAIPLPPRRSDITATTSSVRVRVATEDVDHFHRDAEQFITYFGDMMMRDFFQPVESYQLHY